MSIYAVVFLIVIALDRVTKLWALQLQGAHVITPWLSFATTYNHGISWGLLQTSGPVERFMIASLIAVVMTAVAWYGSLHARTSAHKLGVVLILSGALSNFVDRLMYGGVVDFIELSYRQWVWPNFNVADAAIVIGVTMILMYDIFVHEKSSA